MGPPPINYNTATTGAGADVADSDGLTLEHLEHRLSQALDHGPAADSSARFYLHIADQVVASNQQPIVYENSTFYVGESFSLTYVIHNILTPFLSDGRNYQNQLFYPIAKGFDPSDMRRQNVIHAQKALLQERDILYCVSPDVLERLLRVYFRWFHPAFPILEQAGFLQKCLDDRMSLLVLNALMLVAFTICDDAELAEIGCTTRYQARELFYRQAKALYDADLDPDKVNNVTAVFLMSFWWGGSNDEKDSWHWIGIAISLAQTLGMHRSYVIP